MPCDHQPPVVTAILVRPTQSRAFAVVHFNENATRLIYTERPREEQHAHLISVAIGSHERQDWGIVPGDEAVVAPNGQHIAFVAYDNVWIARTWDVPTAGSRLPDLTTPAGARAVGLRQVTVEGGGYAGWQDSATLTWGLANTVYREHLLNSTAAIAVVARIQLRVPRPRPGGRLAFINARLITMRGGEVLPYGTLVVDQNRIVAIGAAGRVRIPHDATIVDAKGTTLIPGFIDVHYHHLHGVDPQDPQEVIPEQSWPYVANLAYGVTTAFDPAGMSADVFARAELVEAAGLIGPRIFTSGIPVLGESRDWNPGYVAIDSLGDARHAVRRLREYGALLIKEYEQPRRDQRQWILEAAREAGVGITAEGGYRPEETLSMVLDGYAAWEHALRYMPLYGDVVKLAAMTGACYTPTLVVSLPYFDFPDYMVTHDPNVTLEKARRFIPPSGLWRGRPVPTLPTLADMAQHARDAATIAKAGGCVAVGAHGIMPGLGTHWEMWGLVLGGLAPLEALRAGTLRGAEKLGLAQDLGSLEPGKLADFVVLDANPLEDIHNSTKIRYVVKNGMVYDAESMTEIWPRLRPLQRFHWQSPQEAARVAAPAPRLLRTAQ